MPDGYIVLPSSTYSGFVLLRSNLKGGSEADVARAVAYGKRVKFYPLSQAANPPPTKFVDAIDVVFDSTIPYDLRFFEALDRFVQREPWLDRDRVMIDVAQDDRHREGQAVQPGREDQAGSERRRPRAHAWLDHRYERLSPAVLRGHALGVAGVAGGARRDDDGFRQSRRVSGRRPRHHLLIRVFQPQAPG